MYRNHKHISTIQIIRKSVSFFSKPLIPTDISVYRKTNIICYTQIDRSTEMLHYIRYLKKI